MRHVPRFVYRPRTDLVHAYRKVKTKTASLDYIYGPCSPANTWFWVIACEVHIQFQACVFIYYSLGAPAKDILYYWFLCSYMYLQCGCSFNTGEVRPSELVSELGRQVEYSGGNFNSNDSSCELRKQTFDWKGLASALKYVGGLAASNISKHIITNRTTPPTITWLLRNVRLGSCIKWDTLNHEEHGE
jgi:hypothetical protein